MSDSENRAESRVNMLQEPPTPLPPPPLPSSLGADSRCSKTCPIIHGGVEGGRSQGGDHIGRIQGGDESGRSQGVISRRIAMMLAHGRRSHSGAGDGVAGSGGQGGAEDHHIRPDGTKDPLGGAEDYCS